MWSCVKISEGCQHCYAERLNERRSGPPYAVGKDTLRLDEAILTQPLRWKRSRRIFVCSMTDLFEDRVDEKWLYAVFDVMAQAQQHTFQVLSKRAERMAEFCSRLRFIRTEELSHLKAPGVSLSPERRGPPVHLPNVWLGTSVENQARADERIPWLLKTPAAIRFLSVEPLLQQIDLSRWLPIAPRGDRWERVKCEAAYGEQRPRIAWVIVGGESGGLPERALVRRLDYAKDTGAGTVTAYRRYLPKEDRLEWVRALRDQCVAAEVPFFFKQWGGPRPTSGGAFVDGKIWHQFPDGL